MDDGVGGLEWLSALPRLEVLDIATAEGSDLTPIGEHADLRELTLDTRRSVDLSPLAGLERLEALSIEWPGKGLHRIAGLQNLRRLVLEEYPRRDLGLVANMVNLRELKVVAGAADISGLSGLTNLRTLELERTAVTDSSLASIMRLSHIETLSLSHSRNISDITPVGALDKLRCLDLSEMANPLRSLEPLARCSSLEKIDATRTEVADGDLSPLYALPNFKNVRSFIYSHAQRRELESKLAGCTLTLRTAPTRSDYIKRGSLRIWKPQPSESLSTYRIDQDLCDILGVGDQSTAEDLVQRKFQHDHPELSAHVEFDSEAEAFVAHSESRQAILALADTILNLRCQRLACTRCCNEHEPTR